MASMKLSSISAGSVIINSSYSTKFTNLNDNFEFLLLSSSSHCVYFHDKNYSKFVSKKFSNFVFHKPGNLNSNFLHSNFIPRLTFSRLNSTLDSSDNSSKELNSHEENLNWPCIDDHDLIDDIDKEKNNANEEFTKSQLPFLDRLNSFIVLNFYHFAFVKDPHEEVKLHREFMEGKDILGRIYISEQGINAQLSGPKEEVLSYANFVKTNASFSNIHLQVSPSPIGHAFPRLKLRYKESLVQVEGGTHLLPLTDFHSRAIPLSPSEWKKKIEQNLVMEKDLNNDNNNYDNDNYDNDSNENIDNNNDNSNPSSVQIENQNKKEDKIVCEVEGEREEGEGSDAPSSFPPSSSQYDKKGVKSLRKTLLLDVRNGYEWDVGHFKGAIKPNVDSFRTTKFGLSSSSLSSSSLSSSSPSCAQDGDNDPLEAIDKENTDILMYCTGGIRCDVYSTILKQKGFQNLYTLKGGIANYLKEEGNAHWFGNLFVFDSRLSVPPSLYQTKQTGELGVDEESSRGHGAPIMQFLDDGTITSVEETELPRCNVCATRLTAPKHRNCSNLDCNALFLSCDACSETHKGACSDACSCAERMRPFIKDGLPYQRWHNYRPAEPKSITMQERSTRASRRRERRAARKNELNSNLV